MFHDDHYLNVFAIGTCWSLGLPGELDPGVGAAGEGGGGRSLRPPVAGTLVSVLGITGPVPLFL